MRKNNDGGRLPQGKPSPVNSPDTFQKKGFT